MRFILVRDNDVQKFCYWENGICQGMQYANDFYKYVATVCESNRLEAYSLSNELLESGETVCLTISEEGYSVWRCLRQFQEI
ncbi:MAG: hypothetical protein F6K16_29525 [Symploca sp. SIO2B6]|nr:hypothetical protein [Symploca sp. SIO2B6]